VECALVLIALVTYRLQDLARPKLQGRSEVRHKASKLHDACPHSFEPQTR
jgi:hypothetical protein